MTAITTEQLAAFLAAKADECLATVKHAEDNADDWAGALPADVRHTLDERLAALEREPDAWVRENARGVLLGSQCCRCLATLVTGREPPRRKVLCPQCVGEVRTT